MRLSPIPFAVAAVLLAAPAHPQELPVSDEIPPDIAAAEAARGEMEGSTSWLTDLNGDGREDRLVHSLYPFPGGNAMQATLTAYYAMPDGSFVAQELDLPRFITSVRREGAVLVFTLPKLLDGDARCCPSGQEEVRMQFQ